MSSFDAVAVAVCRRYSHILAHLQIRPPLSQERPPITPGMEYNNRHRVPGNDTYTERLPQNQQRRTSRTYTHPESKKKNVVQEERYTPNTQFPYLLINSPRRRRRATHAYISTRVCVLRMKSSFLYTRRRTYRKKKLAPGSAQQTKHTTHTYKHTYMNTT